MERKHSVVAVLALLVLALPGSLRADDKMNRNEELLNLTVSANDKVFGVTTRGAFKNGSSTQRGQRNLVYVKKTESGVDRSYITIARKYIGNGEPGEDCLVTTASSGAANSMKCKLNPKDLKLALSCQDGTCNSTGDTFVAECKAGSGGTYVNCKTAFPQLDGGSNFDWAFVTGSASNCGSGSYQTYAFGTMGDSNPLTKSFTPLSPLTNNTCYTLCAKLRAFTVDGSPMEQGWPFDPTIVYSMPFCAGTSCPGSCT